LLGDDFLLPNRMILAVLCTASGAAGLLMRKRAAGMLALIVGLGLMASVPVTHEIPIASFSQRLHEVADTAQQVLAYVQPGAPIATDSPK
jgi:hypothetical protein